MSLKEPKLTAVCKACNETLDAFNDDRVTLFVDGFILGIKWKCQCGQELKIRWAELNPFKNNIEKGKL